MNGPDCWRRGHMRACWLQCWVGAFVQSPPVARLLVPPHTPPCHCWWPRTPPLPCTTGVGFNAAGAGVDATAAAAALWPQVMTQCGAPGAAEEHSRKRRQRRRAQEGQGLEAAPAAAGGGEGDDDEDELPTAILYIKRRAAFCTGCCACDSRAASGSSSSNSISRSNPSSRNGGSSSSNSGRMLSLRAGDLLAAHMAVERPMWVAGASGGSGGSSSGSGSSSNSNSSSSSSASVILASAFRAAMAAGGQLLAGDVRNSSAPAAGSGSTGSSRSTGSGSSTGSSSSSSSLRLTHPLVLYGGDVVDMQESVGISLPKSIALPHRTAYTNPHTPFPMNLLLPGDRQTPEQAAAEVAPRGVAGFTGPRMQRVATARSECAHWLHLRAQVGGGWTEVEGGGGGRGTGGGG